MKNSTSSRPNCPKTQTGTVPPQPPSKPRTSCAKPAQNSNNAHANIGAPGLDIHSSSPQGSPLPSDLTLDVGLWTSDLRPAPKRRGPVLDRRTTWERLSRIDDLIASGTYPSTRSMALKLGVTMRTITRDIEFLKKKRKLPIAYDQRRYGFYYTKPVREFSKPPMTEADIFAVLVAHKSIAQYNGTPFEKPLRLAFEKLTGQLDNRELHSITNLGDALSFRPIAPEDFDTSLYHAISKAMGESREILFRYRNGGDDRVTPRRVQPWHLVACDHRWYLIGYNVHQHQVRTYALSRMSEPRILDIQFTKPADFDPNEHFKDCLGVMKGDGNQTYEVVVELDRFGTDLVRGRRWHSSQQLIPLPNGCSRLIVRLGCLDEIERTILSWGTHATVIGPEPLRQRLARIAADLTAKYGPSLDSVIPFPEHNQRFLWQ